MTTTDTPLTPEGGGKKKRKVNAPHYKKLWQESEAKINSIQNRTIWFIMWLTLALVVMFGSIAIAFVLNK